MSELPNREILASVIGPAIYVGGRSWDELSFGEQTEAGLIADAVLRVTEVDLVAAGASVIQAARRWAEQEQRRLDALHRMDWSEMDDAKRQLQVYVGPALQAAVAALPEETPK